MNKYELWQALFRPKQGELSIGDRVRIAESSEFYNTDDPYNPIEMTGTITHYRENHHFNWIVDWDNGRSNTYSTEDLEIV